MTQQFDLETTTQPQLEEKILEFWAERDIFEKSMQTKDADKTFTFYEGPPTANGLPGIHHVLARAIKDIFCRYKTMKGYRVSRKAGWDTHGLPVEIEVEKELGLKDRKAIEEYGIARYNQKCRQSVLRYKDIWDKLTTRIGYWVDLSDPYITYKNKYIETIWWMLKELHRRELLYKGYKIQWYSPGSGTVLSSHEVSLGYRDVDDPSITVHFPLGDGETSFLVWTTTPWTLISNVALAVGPDIDYVTIRTQGVQGATQKLILAETRLEVINGEYEIIERIKGSELIGQKYKRLYDFYADADTDDTAWRVIPASFVSVNDGTGIVHMAPAFGADDYQAAQENKLPMITAVNPDGTFAAEVDFLAGTWFKDADKPICRNLRERGLMYKHETVKHSYPFDWRKGTPLMNYPVESWFIRTTRLKEQLIGLNATINWVPDYVGTGRFGEWLKNNVDWALSRRRFWGTPLPIWVSDKEDSTHYEVIGSIEELREKVGEALPQGDELDLHRPHIDELTWPAPDGGTMRRVKDVIDVWFDSGAMPFAQWHYPFENKEIFEKSFPADFIAEGLDQTRGWFYTLHALATMLTGKVAFHNVVVNGLVLDEKGEKMSKSKGNRVEPFAIVEKYGADYVRWYMIANSPPWENLKFSLKDLSVNAHKFFSTLANLYSFFGNYANIDGYFGQEAQVPIADRSELDRWILSRLNTTIRQVDEAYAVYHPTRAARLVEQFVDDLSNWYVRKSRRRFWRKAEDETENREKLIAYQTLHQALLSVAKLMSPIAPFYSEWLYQKLAPATIQEQPESVHLADFPPSLESYIDDELEHNVKLSRTICSIVLALRNTAGIFVRQPLPRLMVVTGTQVSQTAVENMRDIILDEVNVKSLQCLPATNDIVKRSLKPNFRRLGPRLGKLMKNVAGAIARLTDAEVDSFVETNSLNLIIDDQEITFDSEDIEVVSQGIEGWQVGQESGITVALDMQLTDALISEGLVRETLNRVQNLRKQKGLALTDRIDVAYHASERLAEAIASDLAFIKSEVLALQFTTSDTEQWEETFDIGTEQLKINMKHVTS